MSNSSTSDEDIFHTAADLDLEKAGVKAFYVDQVMAGRDARPMVIYFSGPNRIMSIMARTFTSDEDEFTAMQEMLFLIPALKVNTTLLSFKANVQLVTGLLAPALVMVATTRSKAFTEIFPYEITDEGVVWNDEKVDVGRSLNIMIQHMLPVFNNQTDSAFLPTDLVRFLEYKGHEIQFFEHWHYGNLDRRLHFL